MLVRGVVVVIIGVSDACSGVGSFFCYLGSWWVGGWFRGVSILYARARVPAW